MATPRGPLARSASTRRVAGPRTAARLVAAALAGLALAGCQVQPLYSTGPGLTSAPLATELGSIAIDPPAGRLDQLVRNELAFAFGNDGSPDGATYRLALRSSQSSRSLQLSGTGAALGRSIAVTATYQLLRIGEREVLATNTVTAAASYDAVDQRFSNQRAIIDAETRAAREVAEIIRAQVAAVLSR